MIRKIAVAAVLFLLSGPAANAAAVCTLSAADIAFGEIQFAKTNLTETGAVVIRCTGSGSFGYAVALSTGFANQYSPREMTNGATAFLPYNLYSQTTLTSIWGNGAAASTLVTGTINLGGGSTAIVSLPVYGRIKSRTLPAPGSYLDIINVTMVAIGIGGPVNTTFQVTAHVSNLCTISATELHFADYNQAQLDDGQSQIHLTCTDATPWDVGLDGGRFPGALVSRRSMSGPNLSQLDYQLFTDPARTVVWGNNVGSDTVSGTGNGIPQTLNVYGRIPAGQSVRGGGYVDTIVATVTF